MFRSVGVPGFDSLYEAADGCNDAATDPGLFAGPRPIRKTSFGKRYGKTRRAPFEGSAWRHASKYLPAGGLAMKVKL